MQNRTDETKLPVLIRVLGFLRLVKPFDPNEQHEEPKVQKPSWLRLLRLWGCVCIGMMLFYLVARRHMQMSTILVEGFFIAAGMLAGNILVSFMYRKSQ